MEVVLTDHAVERYRDRVRPMSEREAVEVELALILPLGEITAECPVWAVNDDEPCEQWLVPCPGIAFPLYPDRSGGSCLVATTCLTNRGLSEETRRNRNRENGARRAARRRHRQKWVEKARRRHDLVS